MECERYADQAGTLRQLSRNFDMDPLMTEPCLKVPRVISVTSGKGGVGKTVCAANMAVIMARRGHRVLVIDADLGLANIDLYFGITSRFNLNHFFSGQKRLEEILIPAAERIHVLPAGSGVQQYTHLEAAQRMRFMESLDALHSRFDVVLIDTEAGISENVTYFTVAAHEILLITTPEPTAISDGYALMKLLSTRYYERHFKLIVNFVASENEALDVYHKLTLVSSRFIDISIDFLGAIPLDSRFTESVRRQKTLTETFPGSPPSLAFADLVDSLELQMETRAPKGTQQFFWKQLLACSGAG
ncbi:MAG: MinD/ParA family protein [Deltaproteobacteria bacterium]|nr:MinD/ParA family protein [Deltaproteobacteria bacterium]